MNSSVARNDTPPTAGDRAARQRAVDLLWNETMHLQSAARLAGIPDILAAVHELRALVGAELLRLNRLRR